MGQKVSPIGFRVGINKSWDSTWYAGKEDFAKFLLEDNKIRNFLKAVTSKDKIINLLSEDGNRDIKINVKIGSEGYDELPPDCSLVSATYSANGVQLGTYGVIGPVRMDYKKVVAVLENVGKILESIIVNKDK